MINYIRALANKFRGLWPWAKLYRIALPSNSNGYLAYRAKVGLTVVAAFTLKLAKRKGVIYLYSQVNVPLI